ncbi:MAG: signal peptidase I [Roseiarcus sp.]|jgi:signal peptidase I
MAEAGDPSSVNPWRALWFRPGLAVEAVLARDRRITTLALAALGSVFGLLADASRSFHLFAAGPSQTAWLIVLVIALAGALGGVVGLYIAGWIVAAVARAVGGRGSAAGARAAYAWGSVPLLIPLFLTSALGLVPTRYAAAPWLIVPLAAVLSIGLLWAIVVAIAMLARVQGFGVARAVFSGVVGWFGVPFAFAFVVRTLAFQAFDAASGSMAPTLQSGDYVLVSKWAYGYSRYSLPFAPAWFEGRLFAGQPRRGDVVVFVHPQDGADWVKRIVGLPGETIQMKGGRLFINGEVVERRRIKPGFAIANSWGKTIEAPTYDEMLPGGATHRIIQIDGDHGHFDDTAPFATPPDAYFVMGDNRDNSIDSRVPRELGGFGFVPFANIVGRAGIIYYSIDANWPAGPATPRFERIGLAAE